MQLTGRRFFVMGDLGEPSYAALAGLEPCRDPAAIDSCCGVIGAEGVYDWYTHMQAVLNFFRRHPERPFIVPNPDSCWPSGRNGEIGIGAGAQARFITGLLAETGIRVEPLYLGKPYPGIYRYALHRLAERFGLGAAPDPAEVVMVGDSLASDIRGANCCGMVSVLVLSGITDAAAAERATGDFRPSLVFRSLE